ncbi:MAG: DUF1993 domain-containing protein [Pseudomonadota bacterium]|nr:DUF1993 domain-containing protein [Pseudomonadota bacterium]
MNISMYQASVPVFKQTLTALAQILEKAQQHAEARKIAAPALLNARLFPDMFDLTRQVQIATDFARGTAARLAGKEPPPFEDTEQTFPDVISRVRRTIEYLDTITAQEVDGSEGREIVRPMRGEPHRFTGINYLLQYALPNFFFHAATAYNLLRHNGLEIGKRDFIGPLD